MAMFQCTMISVSCEDEHAKYSDEDIACLCRRVKLSHSVPAFDVVALTLTLGWEYGTWLSTINSSAVE